MKIGKGNWITRTVHIDADTGEHLTEYVAKTKYKLIKIKKNLEYAERNKTTRILKVTRLYRNNQQLELFGKL